MTDSQEPEPWNITIVRAHGLRLMRPEKSWRPIVTLEVDRHHAHETVLGVDGQNPNLKEEFCLHAPTPTTHIELKVWHRAQSKKKGKKRSLVGCATHSLGELAKRAEGGGRIELRLTCQSTTNVKHKRKPAPSSRGGKPQNGASVVLRLRAPTQVEGMTGPPLAFADLGYVSGSCVSVGDSETRTQSMSRRSSVTSPSSSEDEEVCPPEPTDQGSIQLLRRRRPKPKKVKPFMVDSDCGESSSSSGSESYWDDGQEDEKKPLIDDSAPYPYFQDDDEDDGYCSDSVALNQTRTSARGWLAFSLLPSYAETIKLDPPARMSRFERAVAAVTVYEELKEACLDSHFERVFGRMVVEWTYVGGLLVALAAVDTAVFSISPGSIFEVSPMARDAIAASSVASGLGIACDAWFLFRYGWVDMKTFITRAQDVFSTYLFFSLSSRVPALCMLISATALMGFLAVVAYTAFPAGVLAVCFLVGVVMSLQFLAYGVVKVVEGGRRCVEGGKKGVRVVARRLTGGG